MQVSIETSPQQASVVVVTLPPGRLDAANVSRLRMELGKIIKFHKTHVLLDCADVTFIDSMGMSLVFSAFRACRQYGAEVKLAHIQKQPKLALALVGLDDFLMLYDSKQEAMEAFKPGNFGVGA